MPIKIKNPRINKKTKFSSLLNNNIILSNDMEDINYVKIKKSLGFTGKDIFTDIIEDKFISGGNQKYIISGKVKYSVVDDNANEKLKIIDYSFPIMAKSNLSAEELKHVVNTKLINYYEDIPREGFSNIVIRGSSFNSFQIPDDYKFHSRVRVYQELPLMSKLFQDTLNNQDIKIDTNCLVDYLHSELSKFYKKKSNKTNIIKELNKLCNGDVITYGCSLEAFKTFMSNNFKCVHYTVLGPDFKSIMYHRSHDTNNIKLVFYVNNSHLYPITNTTVQKIINKKICNGTTQLQSYFNTLYDFEFYNDFIYMEKQLEDIEEFDIERKTYIINKNDDITEICKRLMNETNYTVEFIDIDKTGKINMFKHPTKDIMICNYDDFLERKKLMQQLDKLVDNNMPLFKNQSYPCIASSLLSIIGYVPKSYYNKETFYYLTEYEPKPIVETLENCKKEDLYMVDISKHYSSIMYNWYSKKGVYIPCYDVNNNVEKFNVNDKIEIGEYYIQEKKINGITFGGCFLHYFVIVEMLNAGYIELDDIKYCIKTPVKFNPKCFKKFIDITKKLDATNFKKLNNLLNGTMKNNKKRRGKAYVTNDINAMCYLINDAEINNKKYSWQTSDDIKYHFLKIYSEENNYFNTSAIYRTCLSFALLDVLNLISRVVNNGCKIVKVKTDAVYYINETPIEEDVKQPEYFKNIGKVYHDFVNADTYKKDNYIKPFEKYEIIKKDKCIVGSGGSGKSYKAVEDADINKRILILSYSNNAVNEIQQKAYLLKGDTPNWSFKTIAMFYSNLVRIGKKQKNMENALFVLNSYEQIILEEFSMCPINFLRVLSVCNTPVIYVGDNRQLPPILQNTEQSFDLLNFLLKWCDVEYKKYNPKFGRYDKRTYNIIEKFRNTGYTHDLIQKLKKVDDKKIYELYLVTNNNDKDKYNKLCCDYFNPNGKEFIFQIKKTKENKDEDEDFGFLSQSNKSKKQQYKLGKNSPIICLENDKELKKIGICNNWKGKLISYDNTNVCIEGFMYIDDKYINHQLQLDINTFQSYFNPLYASTVHKFQGAKIDKPYAIIINSNKYRNRELLYTALSRTTNYKYIHISDKLAAKYFWINHFYENEKRNDDKKYNIKYLTDNYYLYYNAVDDCYEYRNFKKPEIIKEYFNLDVKLPFLKEIKNKCSVPCVKNIIRNLQEKKKKEKNVIVIQKPQIKQTYNFILPKSKNKIVIGNDRIKFIYYENDKRLTKEMKTKKKGVETVMNNMNDFIKNKGFEKPEIINNSKLVLSFC